MRNVTDSLLCHCSVRVIKGLCLFWHLISSTIVKSGRYPLHITDEETESQRNHGHTANILQSLNLHLELSGFKSFAFSNACALPATVQTQWGGKQKQSKRNPLLDLDLYF